MYKEFSKISLHNHFGGPRADYCFGESATATKSFDLTAAQAKIDSAASQDFQLLGFTNHNHFWKNEFKQLKSYIELKSYNITLIPGVEFDLKKDLSDVKRLHVVLLASDRIDLDKFESEISAIISSNSQNAISIEQLIEFCFDRKCILIPHGNKQNDKGAIENKDSFEDMLGVRDYIPMLIENRTTSKKEYLVSRFKDLLNDADFEWLENSVTVSSADQSDFSSIIEPTYIWAPPSFDALFYCSIIGNDRFYREQDIIQKSQVIDKLVITNRGGDLKDSTITFSHGLNAIVGNSGSGKTLLLNLINKLLTGNNLQHSVSSSDNNYEEIYKNTDFKLYNLNGEEISRNTISVFEGESLYKQVVKTIGLNKSELLKEFGFEFNYRAVVQTLEKFNKDINDYVQTSRKILENKQSISSSLFKFANEYNYLKGSVGVNNNIEYTVDPAIQGNIDSLEEKISDFQTDLTSIQQSMSYLKGVIKKYNITSEEIDLKNIEKTLTKIIKMNIYKEEKELIKYKATQMRSQYIYDAVSGYNKSVGARALSINKSKQNIVSGITEIVNLLKDNAFKQKALLIPTLSFDPHIDQLKHDNFYDFIKLDSFVINLKIDYDNLPYFFDSAIGSSPFKINKSAFASFKQAPLNLESQESMKTFLDVFVENVSNLRIDFNFIDDGSLIKYETYIEKERGNFRTIESLSAGELSKLYINLLIDKKLEEISNSAIILYDQPDNNLEKTFILESLVKKLCDLKKKYQVIITTHEPLLVINADSNSIIKAANDPVAGKNNICFENVVIFDSTNKNEAVEKIAKLIDGSKDAVKIRSKIYGGTDLW